eukprot:2981743-Amphidinium_carterae.1
MFEWTVSNPGPRSCKTAMHSYAARNSVARGDPVGSGKEFQKIQTNVVHECCQMILCVLTPHNIKLIRSDSFCSTAQHLTISENTTLKPVTSAPVLLVWWEEENT